MIRLLLCGLLALAGTVHAQITREPDAARLITTDIVNFWRAMDRAAGKDSTALIQALREEYIGRASPGLRDFMNARLVDRTVEAIAS